MSDTKYKRGDRIQYISGGGWKPYGTITKISPAVTVDGMIASPEMYKMLWDENKEESGWIDVRDLVSA